jgi:hypothetical protein
MEYMASKAGEAGIVVEQARGIDGGAAIPNM